MAYTVEDLCRRGIQLAFGYLLPVAVGRGTISYGEIAARLETDLGIKGKVFPTHIGAVVGALMQRILGVDEDTPIINVIVVNQTDGEPGDGADGFLRRRFGLPEGRIEENLRRQLVKRSAREVYAFKDWPAVYRRVFKHKPPSADPVALIEGTEADGTPPLTSQHFGGAAESDEHKQLKAYVLAHPWKVGAPSAPDAAEPELLLHSGDEVDVYLAAGNKVYLIEVKSILSSDPDLRRGIYQCIKYRAVYEAQCKGTMPDLRIIAMLVVGRQPPAFIDGLAKLHKVRLVVLQVNR